MQEPSSPSACSHRLMCVDSSSYRMMQTAPMGYGSIDVNRMLGRPGQGSLIERAPAFVE